MLANRATVLLAALLPILGKQTDAQTTGPTASEIVHRIRDKAAVTLRSPTVDTFKAGDSIARVTGIAVTMMATFDVLQRAADRGDNLIITHEPTFYSHRDTTGLLESESDPVLAAKRKLIVDRHLVIWRFHDTPHAMKPDLINAGIVRALGWSSRKHDDNDLVFDLAPTTLRAVATVLSEKLGANATRISGNPDARIARVALTQGFQGFGPNRHAMKGNSVDALIIGEDHEWETIEYAVDAIAAGQLKGLIVLGHIASEQAGMEEVARWLRTFIPDTRVDFIPTREPFRPATR